jgi:hypothetical protein
VNSIQFENHAETDEDSSDNSSDVSEELADESLDDEAPEEDNDFERFEIELGSSKLPRFSCANHKLNLAIKTAIGKNRTMKMDIRKTNSFISSVRRSHNLNRIFQNYDCRLRLDNATRWSSTFLSLETIQKAHKKKIFDHEILANTFPLKMKRIETYLEILYPLYLTNISFQDSSSSISDVIPSILNLVHGLEKYKAKSEYSKTLCKDLVNQLNKRFEFELNSEIYKVNFVYFKIY